MASEFFDDPDKITYPEADTLVDEYVAEKRDTRTETTSMAVIDHFELERSHHNRTRIYDALTLVCDETDHVRAGRKVFELPDPSEQ